MGLLSKLLQKPILSLFEVNGKKKNHKYNTSLQKQDPLPLTGNEFKVFTKYKI